MQSLEQAFARLSETGCREDLDELFGETSRAVKLMPQPVHHGRPVLAQVVPEGSTYTAGASPGAASKHAKDEALAAMPWPPRCWGTCSRAQCDERCDLPQGHLGEHRCGCPSPRDADKTAELT